MCSLKIIRIRWIDSQDEQMDASVTETYLGEWKNDKRTGFGISERSDGLRYEGEWFNNRKYGYGVTTFRDGSKEEGKYKNNVLITSQKKKHLFLIRSAKFRERIEAAVNAAQRASKIALQKADIAISRTATARGKAELADIAAEHAREDSELAQQTARQFAPDFRQPGLERLRNREIPKYVPPPQDMVPGKSILHKTTSVDQPGGATPVKSASSTVDSATTTTTTTMTNTTPASVANTTASNVMQAIRRASMKPLPQNQLSPMQNQMPSQSQLNVQNPYQQYPQNVSQNVSASQYASQYPNSIPNQYQANQYSQQNQFVPGSPYQSQYQPANPTQVDQYPGYQQPQPQPQPQQQQQPIGLHGFQNLQAYPSQQVILLAVFCLGFSALSLCLSRFLLALSLSLSLSLSLATVAIYSISDDLQKRFCMPTPMPCLFSVSF
jgi:junctophilin